MRKHTVAENVAKYLLENNIVTSQIEKELGISEGKLLNKEDERMSASEFLELCQYLNVAPEEFR